MPASVSFSTWHADVADLVRRPVAVDRRMDDGVVDERHALLAELVPALRVVLVRRVELGVGAERRQERRLVVGRAADPAVGEPRPFGDRVAAGKQILERLRRLEEGVRLAAVAGVGRHQELVLALGVVQRVVEARDHPRGVAEGRMRRDVLDPLAVDDRPRARRAANRDTPRRSAASKPSRLRSYRASSRRLPSSSGPHRQTSRRLSKSPKSRWLDLRRWLRPSHDVLGSRYDRSCVLPPTGMFGCGLLAVMTSSSLAPLHLPLPRNQRRLGDVLHRLAGPLHRADDRLVVGGGDRNPGSPSARSPWRA